MDIMETTQETPVLSKADFYNRIFSAKGMEEKKKPFKGAQRIR